MRAFWFLPYLVICAVYLVNEWRGGCAMCARLKPLLMPTLLAGFLLFGGAWSWYIVPGLICGFLGDTLLMGKGGKFFVLGLSAFLVGHLFYLAYAASRIETISWLWGGLYALALLIYSVFLYKTLYPGLNGMQIPVALYCLTLAATAVVALVYALSSGAAAGWLVALGALFFVASDSLLALNLFAKPPRRAGFLIMLTYTLAQGLIALGACV